jgi:sugar/nucleoside kinase (ribokinase family)
MRAVVVGSLHSERPEDPTGLAVVCVTPDGENAIVVVPG